MIPITLGPSGGHLSAFLKPLMWQIRNKHLSRLKSYIHSPHAIGGGVMRLYSKIENRSGHHGPDHTGAVRYNV